MGLYLGKSDSCIERVEKKVEKLSLLARGDGIEIMKEVVQPNVIFHVAPGIDEGLMEFFYIISGTVVCEKGEETITLGAGEYFYVKDLKESVYLKTITEVSMLYVANQPVFHFLSDVIKNITEMRQQVEKKDMYTHDHGLRLEGYAIRIGQKLNMTKARLLNLGYAAGFHDLGKINVPDEVLKKPGKLTNEEFEYIKKHPADGAVIIENTFIKDCAMAILQHHERLDGSGYPNKLKGDEISLEGKIIAVVDTYDAMTSDRPYRKGMDPKVAFAEIKSLVGKHYDEKIVACFEEVLKEEGLL
ncbi:HD domain-containing protein [Clostridium swellfunianum]|uniref:HD domain-containing phosphohydrolase n=1 Tax=Clostridium swellfunianum TaxID=1367462 RepID=UPI00202E6F92|nr:HD domain-containing phosphohydrolase [Clostridium swellfunianum]MCM0647905.1 HD domain-containing protein [Clostridium swellfunianum]